ncbi:MAG TPA: ABC transporter permease, partial [Polyangiales bacterium]|nr:ABC transporter permease [Polyangiales bacterium]
MSHRILERLALSFLVVFGAVSLIFAILNWLPGDVATMVAGENASAETIEHVRAQLGTSRSLISQYTDYLAGLLHGDLGRSYVTKQPVWDRLTEQFPSTLLLTFSAALI